MNAAKAARLLAMLKEIENTSGGELQAAVRDARRTMYAMAHRIRQMESDLEILKRWAEREATTPPDRAIEPFVVRVGKGSPIPSGHRPVYYRLIERLVAGVLDGTLRRECYR